MGIFGDVSKIMKQAKEIDKTFDPGAQTRDATARMREMNASMEAATKALTEGGPGTAQIMNVGMTTGSMNVDPIMPLDLLVIQEGLPPRPVKISLAIPFSQLHRVVPGAVLPVRIGADDPNAIVIDWAAPAV